MIAWFYEIRNLQGQSLRRDDGRFKERLQALEAAVKYLREHAAEFRQDDQLEVLARQEIIGGSE